MRNRMLIGFAMLLPLFATPRSWTQTGTAAKAPGPTGGTATDVSNAEIQRTLQRDPSAALIDEALRVVSIDSDAHGDYNIGVAIVRRNKTTGPVFRCCVRAPPDSRRYIT